eukprot:3692879-Rhodomonas_salina.1
MANFTHSPAALALRARASRSAVAGSLAVEAARNMNGCSCTAPGIACSVSRCLLVATRLSLLELGSRVRDGGDVKCVRRRGRAGDLRVTSLDALCLDGCSSAPCWLLELEAATGCGVPVMVM